MAIDINAAKVKIQTLMTEDNDYLIVQGVRQIIEGNPDLGAGWGTVAELCHESGDMDAGLIAARRFVADSPDSPERQGMLSEFLVATGRVEEALNLMIPFGEKFPEHMPVHYGIGVMLSRLGRFDEAEARFSRILDLLPSFTLAWEQLAQVHKFTKNDPWVARYQQVEKLEHLIKDEDKPPFFYGLGKLYNDLGDYDRAFGAIKKAAAGKNREAPFNRQAFMAHTDRLESLFTADLLAQETEVGDPSDRPIFIVGVPRSGTTLVDRIISAHSEVSSGGEMPLFRLASLPFDAQKKNERLSLTDYTMEPGTNWASIGQDYLHRLTERFGPNGRVTDKSLVNYLYVYAIMMSLPNARIIYCRRDPVDTAWSNFKTLFGTANLMSYDMNDIALYQATYSRLMHHWQQLRPKSIYEVQYEALVTEPEENIRSLLEFCDLEFEEACLHSHENNNVVSTASFKQVRQPIYKSSVKASAPYARHLAPWVKELREGEVN